MVELPGDYYEIKWVVALNLFDFQFTHLQRRSTATGLQFQASNVRSNSEEPRVRRRFKLSDLPLSNKNLEQWHSLMTPRWIDYVFSDLEDPWHCGDVIDVANNLWKTTFPHIKHEIERDGDPVYSLVCVSSQSLFIHLDIFNSSDNVSTISGLSLQIALNVLLRISLIQTQISQPLSSGRHTYHGHFLGTEKRLTTMEDLSQFPPIFTRSCGRVFRLRRRLVSQ